MTAPRWITEALDAACEGARHSMTDVRKDAVAAALTERLPIEAMAHAAGDDLGLVSEIVRVLTDGDPEVVLLAELYQGACKALDEAGVPYAIEGCALTDMQRRIRWLAQQRPTRAELDAAQATRRLAENAAVTYMGRARHAEELLQNAARTVIDNQQIRDERDRAQMDAAELRQQLAKMTAEHDIIMGRARTQLAETEVDRDNMVETATLALGERNEARAQRDAYRRQLAATKTASAASRGSSGRLLASDAEADADETEAIMQREIDALRKRVDELTGAGFTREQAAVLARRMALRAAYRDTGWSAEPWVIDAIIEASR